MGFSQVPLLCAREVPVPGALPRVIRVLMHYYAPTPSGPRHVYLGEARTLRQDLRARSESAPHPLVAADRRAGRRSP